MGGLGVFRFAGGVEEGESRVQAWRADEGIGMGGDTMEVRNRRAPLANGAEVGGGGRVVECEADGTE